MRRHQDQIQYLLELVQQLAREDEMPMLGYLAAMALEENKEAQAPAKQQNNRSAA
jgi:hypothetical protein